MEPARFKPKYEKVLSAQQLKLLEFRSVVEENEFEFVYEPSDDTFLMLSTLSHELPSFPNHAIVCEIGSGSGIISANLHHWLHQAAKPPLLHLSVDLNIDASALSKRHYDYHTLNIQQINTSILNNISFTPALKPDLIVFNPPYVPVEQEEIENEQKYLTEKLKHVREHGQCVRKTEQNLIAFSYMGGLDGLQITRRILNKIRWDCTAYFIVMGEEGLRTIEYELKNKKIVDQAVQSVDFELMQYEQNPNEDLFVIKAIFHT